MTRLTGYSEGYKPTRFYQTESGLIIPSVTSVTGYANRDNYGLKMWRKKKDTEDGPGGADRASKFAADRGTIFHTLMESYFSGIEEEFEQDSKESISAHSLFSKFKDGFDIDNIREVIFFEKSLHTLIPFYGGYAGTFDMLCTWKDGRTVLVDFKTSEKPKKDSYPEYKIQLVCYSKAVYKELGIPVDGCVNLIVNEQTPDIGEFWVNPADYQPLYIKFLDMLEDFNKNVMAKIDRYEPE